MTTERKWSSHFGALAAGRQDADFYGHAPRLYSAADLKVLDEGRAFTIKTRFPRLADVTFKDLHQLDVPRVMFLGRHVHTVPTTLAADWMGTFAAPQKTTVWFENSAHLP